MSNFTYEQLKEMENNIKDIPISKIKEIMGLDKIEPIKITSSEENILKEDAEYFQWWYEEELRDRFAEWLDECLYDGGMVFYGDEEYECDYGKVIIKNVPYTMYGLDKCYRAWDSMKESFIYEHMVENKLSEFDFNKDWNDELEEELRQKIEEYEKKSLEEKIKMTMKDVPHMEVRDDGRIVIDWDNPEHVKFYEKWMEY